VLELVSLRSAFLEALVDEISSWTPAPVHASLFGSAARGDGDTASDLDILVVRPAKVADDDSGWEEQLAQAGARLRRRTGNDVSWFVVRPAELAAAKRSGEPVVRDWSRDGVHLVGRPLADLLRHRGTR
jgi:predicted nucleotidyltransferase